MPPLLIILLFLHIAAAIIAFGPSYSFPLIMGMAAREPEHRVFAVRLNLAISEKVALPLAVSTGITGVLMIIVGNFPITLWLVLAILLYLGLLSYSFFVQLPLSRQVLAEMGKARGQMATASGARVGGAPAGPPPELAAMVRRSQQGGMGMGAVLLVIVALMVAKPTL